MRRFAYFILIALVWAVNLCYGQRFTMDLQRMMIHLPRSADDFQTKFYDTELESVSTVYSLTLPFMDGIPIMKHNGAISKMLFQTFHTIERFGEKQLDNDPQYSVKMLFNPNGTLSYLNGARRLFAPSVPSSSHVGNAIDLSIDNDMTVEYSRDAQGRVIEAQVLDNGDPYLIFRYSYLPNSKKISTIKGYDSNGKLIGDVSYTYSNGRLSDLYYKGYEYSINYNGPILRAEFKKRYSYDGHGNYSKVDISRWYGTKSSGLQDIYTFENQYNAKGQLIVSRVGYNRIYNSGSRRGGTPIFYTRKYTYDNHDNWIKVDLGNDIVAIREFEYK